MPRGLGGTHSDDERLAETSCGISSPTPPCPEAVATLRLTRLLGAWALKNLSMDYVRHSTDDELELDTSIGGNQSRFPETRRSVVIDCHSADPDVRACAAEALISA